MRLIIYLKWHASVRIEEDTENNLFRLSGNFLSSKLTTVYLGLNCDKTVVVNFTKKHKDFKYLGMTCLENI